MSHGVKSYMIQKQMNIEANESRSALLGEINCEEDAEMFLISEESYT